MIALWDCLHYTASLATIFICFPRTVRQAKDTTLIHDNIWNQYEANMELNDFSLL